MRVARVGRGGHPLILHKINTLLMESDSDDSGDELKQFEVDSESVGYKIESERGEVSRHILRATTTTRVSLSTFIRLFLISLDYFLCSYFFFHFF